MLTHDVPCLMTYEAIDEFANRIKPIRGTTRIPLGERRYYHARYVEREGSNIYVRTYRGDDVLLYSPNGLITLYHGIWGLGNRQIISAILKMRFTTKYANVNKYYLYDMVKHIQYPIHHNKPITIDSRNDYKLVGELKAETKPFVKRAVMRELRKEYADFVTYAIAMNKLSGGRYESNKNMRYPDFNGVTLDNLMDGVRNKPFEGHEEAYSNLLAYITTHWSSFRWDYNNYANGVKYVHLTDKDIKNGFTDYLRREHSDQVFESREVPNTTIVK